MFSAMSKSKKKKKIPMLCSHGVNAKFCTTCRKPVVVHQLSEDQQNAVSTILKENGPFFLTGSAGTGKSYVIDHLRSLLPGCRVTAMTGSAAQIIRGSTLHKFCSIHPLYGVVNSKKANIRVRETDLLIVDEVSMADTKILAQIFDRFDQADHSPKLLLVGDFMQLPPVEGDSLFDSYIWKMFKTLKLTQQHRQSEGDFISILNQMRIGNLSEDVRAFIKSRTVAELPDDCTHLMALRETVQRRNEAKLELLPGKSGRSVWEVSYIDQEDKGQIDLSRSRFTDILRLKENARIVLLTNEEDGLWVNGSTGTVVSITPGCVNVRLDANNNLVSVRKEVDEVTDEDDNIVCRITQYPIMLAWALTIHKAQGMTIDRVGVDLRGHFAPGQTYVALSRCKTAEGLFLKGHLPDLKVNPKALEHS